MTAGELTVVSYNVRAAIGPGEFPAAWWRHVDERRLAAMARLIGDVEADLVALQEVALASLDGRIVDLAAAFAEQTGFDYRFAAVHHYPLREPDSGEIVGAALWGNAVLSRHPIAATATHALPVALGNEPSEPQDLEPRCALATEIETPLGRLEFISTHFAHRGSLTRRLQADRLAALVGSMHGPVVLAGDLNAPIDAPELAALRDALRDAFAETGIPRGDSRRHSFGTAAIAIDHIFVGGLDVVSCRVAREAGDASDHLPVVARLRLSAGAGAS